MFKKIMFLICLLSSSISALELDTKLGFSGSSYPSAFFYKHIKYMPEDMKLAFGFSSIIPFSKTEELDVDLKLGVDTTLPIIGRACTYFTFDNHDGVERTGEYENSDFYTKSLSVAKTWKYPLTEDINLGMTAVLGQVLLNGEYHVIVLPEIFPIMTMTIDIF